MTPSSARPTSVLRRAVVAVATLGLTAGIALVGADAAVAAPRHHPGPGPASIALPVGFQPEGIAVGAGSTFYVGSLHDGDIYRGSLRSGAGDLFIRSDRRSLSFSVKDNPAGADPVQTVLAPIAPMTAESTMIRPVCPEASLMSMIPLPMVCATSVPSMAPTRLKKPSSR